MTMWMIILYSAVFLTAIAFFYVSSRLPKFELVQRLTKDRERFRYKSSIVITLVVFVLITLALNMVNAFVCVIYFAMIWAVCDIISWGISKYRHQVFKHYYAGMAALVLSVLALASGWYLDHHVWQKNYTLTTSKKIAPLKIALFADSHTGTTFDAKGFRQHLQAIQAQNPDMLIIAGDFVDDDTSKEDMILTSQALGAFKSKYGVYFVFGNHDNGYYPPDYRGFGGKELVAELEKNRIRVLRDEAVLVADNFYVIGRRDFSEVKEKKGSRKSMQELVQGLDKNTYMLVMDHQPTDFQKQAEAEVDLVVSGHTHGGQLFPFNHVGEWIGANDLVYGYERRHKTDFIVTSGLSDWAIKFKTGTRSEFVIINLSYQE